MTADLHIHSTCSDGSEHVTDIIKYAARLGLDCAAITDHDTMAGVERAVFEAAKHGVRMIPGIEITTRDRDRNRPVHLLCYLPRDTAGLQAYCSATLKNRAEQKLLMVHKIMELYPITPEDVLARSAGSASIHECHIMRALAGMGYTGTVVGPLMKELLSSGGSCYVPAVYPDVHEALDVIRECGGISVIAHPGQFDSLDLAGELAAARKIDGVELMHPRNSPSVRERLAALAGSFDLITTGGSDFHGCYASEPHPIGHCVCGEQTVERLISLAGQTG